MHLNSSQMDRSMKRTIGTYLFLILCAAVPAVSQRTVTGAAGSTFNRSSSVLPGTATSAQFGRRQKVVVFSGDRVIPQVVDGGGWKTTFILNNLENTARHIQLVFFRDDGTDMFLPIRDGIVAAGDYRNIDLTIPAAATVFFETAGTDPDLLQGWALLRKDNSSDSIGGMAVFQVTAFNSPESEAAVPM